MIQGSLHVQRREDTQAQVARTRAQQKDPDLDKPPRTPPPSAPAQAPGSAIQGPASAEGKCSPSLRKRHTPHRTSQLRGLEDSLTESEGLDSSLDISMLSSSMTSVSAAPTSALMLTMGKMRKKDGHGIMAKESPVNCWIEGNFFVVKAEGDQQPERWDLGGCKVVPPRKLDRIKLQTTSSSKGMLARDCIRQRPG